MFWYIGIWICIHFVIRQIEFILTINLDKNSNLDDNLHNFVDEGSLRHIFRHGSKDCQPVQVLNVNSTTTKDYINVLFRLVQTILVTTSKMWFILSLTINVSKCELQYVRETCQRFSIRFNQHNSYIKNPTLYSFCKILNAHFSAKIIAKKKKKKKNAAKPESLEKGIGCMNCKEFYYMVLMAR